MRRSAAALGRRVQQTAPQHRCRPTLKVSSQHMNWNELNLSATSRPSYTQFTSPGQTRQNSPVCVVSASAVWIGFSTTQDCSRQKKWSLNTLITSALHSARQTRPRQDCFVVSGGRVNWALHDALIGHVRQRHDLIGCSECPIRTSGAQSVRALWTLPLETSVQTSSSRNGVEFTRCEQTFTVWRNDVSARFKADGKPASLLHETKALKLRRKLEGNNKK